MMLIPLSYNLLFGNSSFYDSLKEIEVPSSLVIALLSGINHKLFVGEDSDKIFKKIIHGWPQEFKDTIDIAIQIARSKTNAFIPVFSEWTITEYLKRELLYYNDLKPDWNSPTGKLEFVIIIRYLKYVDVLMNKDENKALVNDEFGHIDFQRTSYPSFLKQFQFTGKSHPVFEMLCCYSFLKIMMDKFPEETNYYLSTYQVKNEWEFATSLMSIISESIPNRGTVEFPLIKADNSGKFKMFYENRIIDVKEYQNDENLQLRYIGLQSKPLYQIDETNLCVMSWRFLYSNIGIGVLFDYFKRTKINSLYGSIAKFKSEIVSLHVYERNIFKPLIKSIYTKKHTILEFDNGNGTPDCYLREGNRLFLFEFKDMLFSDKVVDSGGYDDIIQLCRRNLLQNDKGSPKGLGQIANQIAFLNNGHYEFDDFTSKKVKRSSITIYPIVVYSHKQFSFSGINKYVTEEFQKIIPRNNFKQIYKPTLISLDFIFSRSNLFATVQLDEIIRKYHRQIVRYKENLTNGKYLNEEKWFKSLTGQYNSIELSHIEFEGVKEDDSDKRDRVIHRILNEFGVPNP